MMQEAHEEFCFQRKDNFSGMVRSVSEHLAVIFSGSALG